MAFGFDDILGAVAGPLIGGLMGGNDSPQQQQPQQVNQTVSNAPWEPIHPYLIGQYGLYPEAQKVYQEGVGSFSPETLAPVDPATIYGYGSQLENAMGAGNLGASYLSQVAGQFPALSNAMNFGLTGSLDVMNNPAVAAQIAALNTQAQVQRDALANQTKQRAEQLTTDYTRAFNEQTLPQLRGGAIGAGQFGSSRDDLATGLAQSRSGQELTRTLANLGQNQLDADKQLAASQQGNVASLLGNAYNTGANMFNQSLNVTPRTIGAFTDTGMGLLGQMPAALQGIGQFNQQYEQQRLREPERRLGLFQNIMANAGQMGGQRVSTSPEEQRYSNPLGTALGLGAAGYGIYNYGKQNDWWGGNSGSGGMGPQIYGDTTYYGGASPYSTWGYGD